MTFDDIKALVEAVSYKPGWSIVLHKEEFWRLGLESAADRFTSRPYIQVQVAEWAHDALSPHTGKRQAWSGGKRYLSYHMCRQEIVGACLDAIKSAEMHELHEWFKYKGRSIYNPHLDPEALFEIAKYAKNFSVRDSAMSMEET